MQEAAELRSFVVECIEAAGGLAEAAPGGMLEALVPADLSEAFGHRPLVTLSFSGDAAPEHPDAELVAIGTPALESLIEYASSRGTATCGYVVTDRLRKKGFLETVQDRIILTGGCRMRHDERDQEARYAAYAVFTLRVSMVSDERRERLYVVPVNLWSNRVVPELVPELPRLPVAEQRTLFIPDAPQVPLPEGYATARAWMEAEAARLQESYQARVLRRLEVDYARTSEYYEGIAAELRERREREGDDPERVRLLEEKTAATLAEKERKLHEIADRYRLRTTVRLAAARLLYQPKVFGRFFIDRKQVTRELRLAYDPVLERLELPACEACAHPMCRITVAGDRLVCPACA